MGGKGFGTMVKYMDIADSVLDLIGGTPIVRLTRVTEGIACPVVAKVETTNPGGSVKDRPALAMIEAAEQEGILQPGSTIIEPTSGNTGVGLAIVAAQRGYECVFVMTDKVSVEKVDLLKAYGAEVIVCPVDVTPEDPRSYYSTAERLVSENPKAFRPNQYSNPVNPESHYLTTGPEIWDQTDGRVTHFVAGAGTGGTLCGVGKYLKEQNPDIEIVGLQPKDGSRIPGIRRWRQEYLPKIFDADRVDRIIDVDQQDAEITMRALASEEGIFCGVSSGGSVFGALQLVKELSDAVIVVIVCDRGDRYLSTGVFN